MRDGLVPCYTIEESYILNVQFTGINDKDYENVTTDYNANGYRLPTEAEWEFAARSGGKRVKFSWGNGLPYSGKEKSANIAGMELRNLMQNARIWENYDDGFIFTSPVGTFSPNEIGLYDMAGNVWEWCNDGYDSEYYQDSPSDNPKGIEERTANRVIRGGGWDSRPVYVRNSNRVGDDPLMRYDIVGFRVVKNIPK